MTDITKIWTAPVPARQDPGKPITSQWGNDTWDNLQFLLEWLGADYFAGAVQNHNHDGVNSAPISVFPGLIPNGSFEDISGTLPIGWSKTEYTGGTVASSNSVNAHGEYVLAITSTVLANGGGEAIHDKYKAVAGGYYYSYRMYHWAFVTNISSKIELIWYDASKAQISTTTVVNSTNTPTSSTLLTGQAQAPTNARFVRAKVIGGVPGAGSAVGTVYFDGLDLFRAISTSQILPAAITQTELGAGAAGQGELKTTTGSVSTSSTSGADLTLPGGQYGFYPQLDGSDAGTEAYWGYDISGAVSKWAALNTGTTQQSRIFLSVNAGNIAYAHQRYIQSSPTYWTLDGPVGVYLFLLLNKAGESIAGYIAHEAPWHYNGPTDIDSNHRDKRGYPFRQEPVIVQELWEQHGQTFKEAFMGAVQSGDIQEIERLEDRLQTDSLVNFEITQSYQDKDMLLIPHPFGVIPADHTVVVVDLVSDMNHRLTELYTKGADILNLIHSGYIIIDNNALTRDAPVMAVNAKWRNTAI